MFSQRGAAPPGRACREGSQAGVDRQAVIMRAICLRGSTLMTDIFLNIAGTQEQARASR